MLLEYSYIILTSSIGLIIPYLNHKSAYFSDGAAVMVKAAKLLAIPGQLCNAHGLHLAMIDFMYKEVI